MIEDLGTSFADLCKTYTVTSNKEIVVNGMAYAGTDVSTEIQGMMQPLNGDERLYIKNSGYTLDGKAKLYVPAGQYNLDHDDVLVDQFNKNWKMIEKEDYSELAGYIKYILELDVVQ